MGHLDSQRSLPTIGGDKSGLSPLAKKLREITSQTGYRAVAFVAVDEVWTALRFKKV
jgi:hypothetical protein